MFYFEPLCSQSGPVWDTWLTEQTCRYQCNSRRQPELPQFTSACQSVLTEWNSPHFSSHGESNQQKHTGTNWSHYLFYEFMKCIGQVPNKLNWTELSGVLDLCWKLVRLAPNRTNADEISVHFVSVYELTWWEVDCVVKFSI